MNVLVILLYAAVIQSTAGDIVGTDPEVGSCLCPAGTTNVYDSPCGAVVDTIAVNECYRYTGMLTICTTDIDWHFYQLDIAGQLLWAVGNNLLLEPSQYCSEFPCGAPSPETPLTEGRIIGGTDAVRNMYPWQLAIEEDNDGVWELTCGAALIEANWAVTAAHCVEILSKPLRLVAGVHDRSEVITQDQIRSVNENHITFHPNYSSRYLDNDIAVLNIPQAYDLSTASIRTICLPPSPDTSYVENPSCYLTGWGITEHNTTDIPMVLQRTGIDVISDTNCVIALERPVLDSETCVWDQVDKAVTPCKNDMGGPLSCAINTRFHLAGIGSSTSTFCNPRVPQIYMKVPHFLDWIKDVTGIE